MTTRMKAAVVRGHIYRERLVNINSIFADHKGGKVTGRVVLTLD